MPRTGDVVLLVIDGICLSERSVAHRRVCQLNGERYRVRHRRSDGAASEKGQRADETLSFYSITPLPHKSGSCGVKLEQPTALQKISRGEPYHGVMRQRDRYRLVVASARPGPRNETSTPFLWVHLPHECEERGGQRCRCQGGKPERSPRVVAGRRELSHCHWSVGWLRELWWLNAGIGGSRLGLAGVLFRVASLPRIGRVRWIRRSAASPVAPPYLLRRVTLTALFASRRNAHSHHVDSVRRRAMRPPVDAVGIESCCRSASQNRTSLRGDAAVSVMSMPRQRHGAVASGPSCCIRRIRPPLEIVPVPPRAVELDQCLSLAGSK